METSVSSLRAESCAECRSLGRFFYTQNPFYLISCGFVMYGLLVISQSLGDQYLRANFLTGSLAFYTLLMAVTAIAVIRWGKVWQDARSILLVTMIGQVAFSIAVDELCLTDRKQAGMFLLGGAVGSFLLTEAVLLLSRIRFAASYRCAYYAVVGVFYLAPYFASSFRASDSQWANWTPLFFSVATAAGLFCLAPAMHHSRETANDNGTPWNWPLFPLSAFAILGVLAGFRAHAIWISFGSLRGNVSFEPLLLMPLLLAVVALSMEHALAKKDHERARSILAFSPLLLVCGIKHLATGGLKYRYNSFDAGLERWGGSTMTVAIALVTIFFLYAWMRRIRGAMSGTTLMLFVMAVVAQEPSAFVELGFANWMFGAVASLLWFVRCQSDDSNEWTWIAWIIVTSATVFLAGQAHHQIPVAIAAVTAWGVLMLMFIGWQFDTVLAYKIRNAVAYTMVIAGGTAAAYHYCVEIMDLISPVLLTMAVLAAGYGLAVRRTGWGLIAIPMCAGAWMTANLLNVDTDALGSLAQHHWQLKTGILCFCVGVMITSTKTIAYQRVKIRARKTRMRSGFVRGF